MNFKISNLHQFATNVTQKYLTEFEKNFWNFLQGQTLIQKELNELSKQLRIPKYLINKVFLKKIWVKWLNFHWNISLKFNLFFDLKTEKCSQNSVDSIKTKLLLNLSFLSQKLPKLAWCITSNQKFFLFWTNFDKNWRTFTKFF